MDSPFVALSWEFFRRVWIRFCVALGCGWFITWILAQSAGYRPEDVTSSKSLLVVHVLNMIWCTLCLVSAQSEQRALNDAGMPARWLRLPVSTSRLVSSQMILAAAGMTLLVFLFNLPFLGIRFGYWFGPEVYLFYVMAVVVCETLTWAMVGFVWIRVLVGGIVAVLLTQYLDSFVGMSETVTANNVPPHSVILGGLIGVMGIVIMVCYLVSVQCVSLDRRGIRWPGIRWMWDRFAYGWATSRQNDRPFSSPTAALVWYEWRSRGLTLPLVAGGIAVILLLSAPWAADYPGLVGLAISLAAVCLPLTSYFIGILAATTLRGFSRSSGEIPPCVSVKPVNSRVLAAGRIRSAAASVILSQVVIGVALICFMKWSHPQALGQGEYVMLLGPTLIVAWGLYCIGLSSASTGLIWPAMVVFSALFGVPFSLTVMSGVASRDRSVAEGLQASALIWFGLFTVLSVSVLFILAFRRKLLCSREMLVCAGGVALLLCAQEFQFATLSDSVLANRPLSRLLLFGLPTVALTFQVFGSLGLALHWNRHR
ncbi:MAG: hypothetical protein K1X53_10950 [Candidatus Sumerlaeaceae bacterium]|nr:hypothetical protein [Candidatus Sumerlaeaceae bacterium]